MPTISLCTPDELGTNELARWRELQRADRTLANPFLSPEFTQVVGRHRRDVRVAVLHEGPQTVGFFPHQRDRFGVGRAVGYGISNVQGVVHAKGLPWQPRELLRACRLAVWEFDNLPEEQTQSFQPRHAAAAPVPFIDLSAGWEHWLAAKRAASGTVKMAQTKYRRLQREHGEVTFELNSARREALSLLMRWKSHQYRRTGRPDMFARPWVAATIEDLAQTHTPDFASPLSVLLVEDRPVAVHQGLRANGVLGYWFPTYDVSLSASSPGLVCLLELVRAGAESGLTEIDLGKGHARYKEIFKNGDRTVTAGWVERPSAVAALRRFQQSPHRHLEDFVLSRPRLSRAVRAARSKVGEVRTTLRPI